MEVDKAKVDWFRMFWRMLAEEGFCDDLDTVEYHRVLAMWIRMDFPIPIGVFIMNAAKDRPICDPSA